MSASVAEDLRPAPKPRHYLFGVLVRRKCRIKHFGDDAVVDDEGHPFEERHARGRERRQLDRARKLEPLVGKHRERQVQTLDRFALICGVLRREAENMADAEPLEFAEMIAEAARLRGAPARPGDLVPTVW